MYEDSTGYVTFTMNMNQQNNRINTTKIIMTMVVLLIILTGCRGLAEESLNQSVYDPQNLNLTQSPNESLQEQMSVFPLPDPTSTPTPEPTSSVIQNPTNRTFNFNPSPRISVGYPAPPESKVNPRSVYSEHGLELNGTPVSRTLNILNGPFVIDYTIHPKITDPTYGWVTIQIHDAWENLVADGGYNRNYPSSTSQHLTIYRTGLYYMTMEGNFASVDYTLRTMDPTPNTTPTTPPVQQDEEE